MAAWLLGAEGLQHGRVLVSEGAVGAPVCCTVAFPVQAVGRVQAVPGHVEKGAVHWLLNSRVCRRFFSGSWLQLSQPGVFAGVECACMTPQAKHAAGQGVVNPASLLSGFLKCRDWCLPCRAVDWTLDVSLAVCLQVGASISKSLEGCCGPAATRRHTRCDDVQTVQALVRSAWALVGCRSRRFPRTHVGTCRGIAAKCRASTWVA